MGYIEKRKTGYRARVRRKGHNLSYTFQTKTAANAWIREIEHKIDMGKVVTDEGVLTFGEVCERYEARVSRKKRGAKWEADRIKKWLRSGHRLFDMPVNAIKPTDLAQWRDDQEDLGTLAPASIAREMEMMSPIFRWAHTERGWCDSNPIQAVKKPRKPKARDRLPTREELKMLMDHVDLKEGPPETKRQYAVLAFLLGCYTAMRLQEVCLNSRQNLTDKMVKVPGEICKTGFDRDVPLYGVTHDWMSWLLDSKHHPYKPHNCSKTFENLTIKLGFPDLTFHDSRHMGVTYLSKRLPILQLCMITGHKDLNMVLRVYYKTDGEDLYSAMEKAERVQVSGGLAPQIAG